MCAWQGAHDHDRRPHRTRRPDEHNNMVEPTSLTFVQASCCTSVIESDKGQAKCLSKLTRLLVDSALIVPLHGRPIGQCLVMGQL